MATLQKIRNRAGIAIAIFIGMALAAFILGDLFKSTSMFNRGKQMELGVVGGVTITQPEFQAKVSELEEIYKMNSGKTSLDAQTTDQIKEQTWQNMVRNLTMKDIALIYRKIIVMRHWLDIFFFTIQVSRRQIQF